MVIQRKILFILFVAVNIWSHCLGAELVVPLYSSAPFQAVSTVIGTTAFEYDFSYYSPSVKIDILPNRGGANYNAPEAATISLISAIVANDFDWWFESFDQTRKDKLTENKAELDEIKNQLLSEWSNEYKGKVIKLITYIRYQNYILIDWMAYNPDGTKAFRMLTPLKFDTGVWKVTADEGPISFYLFKWD